jgi:phosphotriesterase-related protein
MLTPRVLGGAPTTAEKRETFSMTDREMSGLAHTVLGPVRPDQLGPTTTHEHLLIDFTLMFRLPEDTGEKLKAHQPLSMENLGWVRYDPFRNRDNLEVLDEGVAVSEALLFKARGGRTIVDATTIGIGRNPGALARIARATGLNIIMGAGYYVDRAQPDGMDDRSEADLGDEMASDIVDGVGDTGVRAGIIGELGCSWPLTGNERKVLAGAAMAQRRTGAAILIHPGRNTRAPFEILDVLAEAGADIGRVIMGHLDRTILDDDVLLELAGRGAYLEFDLFGWETSYYSLADLDMPSDAQRIGYVKGLVEQGHAEQVVLAHDVCTKHRQSRYGGHGISHILENIVPRMRERGISAEDVNSMLVDNPARALTFA